MAPTPCSCMEVLRGSGVESFALQTNIGLDVFGNYIVSTGGSYLSYSGSPLLIRADEIAGRRRFELHMAHAIGAFEKCHAIGGRYWHLEADLHANASRELRHTPSHFDVGVCAPAACSSSDVRVLHGFFIAANPPLTMECIGDGRRSLHNFVPRHYRKQFTVRVTELGRWEDLRLSWAVIGFAASGTTTLAWNLHQHPQLELLYYASNNNTNFEEHFFLYERTRHLPSAKEIADFNQQVTKSLDDSVRHLPLRRGVKRGGYVFNDATLARLARIPRLRVVMVLQDPTIITEKLYLKPIGQIFEATKSMRGLPSLAECLATSPPKACGIWPVITSLTIAERLNATYRAVGNRVVFFATTDELSSGTAFWNRLAAFIGVPPYPEGTTFNRKNVNYHSKPECVQSKRAILADPASCRIHVSAMSSLRKSDIEYHKALVDGLGRLPAANAPSQLPYWIRDTQSWMQDLPKCMGLRSSVD